MSGGINICGHHFIRWQKLKGGRMINVWPYSFWRPPDEILVAVR